MAGASFIVDDETVNAAVARAAAAGADTSKLMNAIAAQMLFGVQRRFEAETGPDGRKWSPLKPATLRARTRGRSNRNLPGAILRDSNLLYSSIHAAATEREAVTGTSLAYAAIHQQGGVIERWARSTTLRLRKSKGRTLFASKRHKRADDRRVTISAHTITIPPRPYLGFSESDLAAILEIAEEHYRTAIAGSRP